MHDFSKKYSVRIWGAGIIVATTAITAAMTGSCVFDTKTNFCEKFGVRCKEGQICAVDQPVCVDIAGCGNNHIDPGEKCDDGNTVGGDGCSADCKSDETCGNGILDTDIAVPEACDHGSNNGQPDDSCLSNCQIRTLFCGNGIVDTGEQCDPGAMDSASCNSNSALAMSLNVDCKTARCGDSYVNMAALEQCDSGGSITASCNGPLCTTPVCGDHFQNAAAGEECDTGNDTQACNGSGNGNANNDVKSYCHIPRCGDSYANLNFTPPNATAPEQCDDGGDTQTCNGNNNGSNGPGSCRTPRCGDKYINSGFTPPKATAPEECDDGRDTPKCNGNNNGTNGIGSCRLPACGDGYFNPTFTPPGSMATLEQCDTGGNSQTCNGNDNDNSTKQGLGNCATPACGDGYFNPKFTPPGSLATPEQCDTGGNSQTCNGNDNDNNSHKGLADCAIPRCGDGYLNPRFTPTGAAGPEQCDKGDPGDPTNGIPAIPPVPCSNQSKTCSNTCQCI